MAMFQVNFFSTTLGLSTRFHVVMPQRDSTGEIGVDSRGAAQYPVLYLLHGLSDDDSIWLRRTSIERYATEKGIAVVMPTTFRGWYIDTPAGKYYSYIGEELPSRVAEFFPAISQARADTYVAGLSMGGYGALHFALSKPDRYAAAASLSGALDIANPSRLAQLKSEGVLRDDPTGTKNDVYYLEQQLASSNSQKPAIYMWCGTEDGLLADSRRMRDLMRADGFDLTYSESTGNHSWPYWDAQIQKVLDWIVAMRKG